jgi:hypothetical protein
MSGHEDFWDEMTLTPFSGPTSMDHHLSEDTISGPKFSSLQDLTDRARDANGLDLASPAGTRVSFVTNIGSVLYHTDRPDPEAEGTIVMVRTALGDATHHNDEIFVKWDDGKLRAIHRYHLRLANTSRKRASSFCFRANSLGDISAFFSRADAGTVNDLIHKSTKDLWSFEQTDDGLVISRLFDDTGEPLKG